jgi:hypothetical protein
MSSYVKTSLYVCFAALVSLWFAYKTIDHLTDAAIGGDGAQNVVISYHLIHTGVWGYAAVETPNPKPWMRREPVPILAISALLLLHPGFLEPYKIADLLDGRLTKTVKLVNVFWRFLTAFFMFLLCRELFPGLITAGVVALVSLVISDMSFLSTGRVVDRLYTELPTCALLLAASWCAVRFIRFETKPRAIYLGVAMGLLALTKAAFFYVGTIFILFLFLLDRLRLTHHPDPLSLRQLRTSYVVMVVAFLASLTPWVLRNAISLGTPTITTRAERVLGLRMLLAEQPLTGLVYASSPKPIKRQLGTLLGYSPADLQIGGRLDGITFAKERARDTYRARMEAAGYKGSETSWVRRSAFISITEHPLRYLMSIGGFAYQGMWFMRPSGLATLLQPTTFYVLNAMSLLCFLGVFFGGLIARNSVLVAAFGLGAGAFMFHSALTHALPRFNAPITPLVIIAVLWLSLALGRNLAALTRRRLASRLEKLGPPSSDNTQWCSPPH